MAVVHTRYYTDPACPWSWALEPAFRRLQHELGESLEVVYVMCGMAREFSDPQKYAIEFLDAGEQSGMPVDPRLWLQRPPRSTHPACTAVKAAAEQGNPAPYLRRLREGFACRRRKLDSLEALVLEAEAVGGLDIKRFRVDLESHAILETFAADLECCSAVSPEHFAEQTNRVKLPSLEFQGPDGHIRGVYGFTSYEELKDAALWAGAAETGAVATIEGALRQFGSMSTPEIATVCQLPGPRAPAELWQLAMEWRVKSEPLGSGELWMLA